MKIVIAVLAVLALTTGFTCSKNPPADQQPAQDQMAAPATTETTMPPATEAAPTEAAPAAPAEAAPANH